MIQIRCDVVELTFSILLNETNPCSTEMNVSGKAFNANLNSENTATAVKAMEGERAFPRHQTKWTKAAKKERRRNERVSFVSIRFEGRKKRSSD